MSNFELPSLKCLRCEHTWIPRQPAPPKVCPHCNSPYWDKPRWKRTKQIVIVPQVPATQPLVTQPTPPVKGRCPRCGSMTIWQTMTNPPMSFCRECGYEFEWSFGDK
ncbi:MAG: hypothetical protein V1767_02235 [Chloroflexota bacterium]